MGHGDELLVTGRARVMQQTDPRKVVVRYEKGRLWREVWDNNPRLARPNETGDFQELLPRTNYIRPYHLSKTPEQYTYNLDFRPDVGEIYFSDAEKEFGAQHTGLVIVDPHIKPGASPNKDWGWLRWSKFAYLARNAGIRLTQLGHIGTPLLDGVDFIPTSTFRKACAVLANARAAVLPEGGTHHAAAAVGLPAVVIFGGFTPIELTGYPMHRNLGASLGEACGMRTRCKHCVEEMKKITPEQVLANLREILDGDTGRMRSVYKIPAEPLFAAKGAGL